MLKAESRRLFPLHIAPIDNFFLLDDRQEYPMTFVSNLFFTGNFDRNAFEAALDDAILLHPLLDARIAPAKQGKPCWVPGNDTPLISWGTLNDPVDVDRRGFIDLRQETGLRVWVRQGTEADGTEQARLVMQFHHACCDGTGAHRFMGDLLAGYGIRTAGPNENIPSVAKYDPQLLKARRAKLQEEFGGSPPLTIIRRSLKEGANVFGRRIAPLCTNGHVPTSDTGAVASPGVVSHTFSKSQHKALREFAKRQGGTLNDLLLAEMFVTMRHWNLEHGASPRQRLRIMMPSDMRDKQDFAMPAANMTSYNFITRHMRQCEDLSTLVRGIRDETAKIKHQQLGRRFIDSIMTAKLVPGLLPLLLSRQRCLSTITMSHMGDPTRRFLATFPRRGGKLVCGDVVLDNMLGVSPLRPQTRAAVSIVTLYRELTINVRCDPHEMSVLDAKKFLDLFVAPLNGHLAPAAC